MRQEFLNLQIKTNGQNLYEFTYKTIDWIKEKKLKNGILNLSIQAHQCIIKRSIECRSRCSN